MRRYRTRGGSVKVNSILSEPPRYVTRPTTPEQLLHTSLAICPSIDYLERAWQDAPRGVPAEGPYIEVEVPTAIDPSLTDDGTTVMTMFTQYGPHDEADWPDGAREAYAQRCLDLLAQYAPNVTDAVVHYEVLAPPDLERIFGLVRRLDLPGRAGPRPDGVHAPVAAALALRDAGARALPVRRRHAPGRRRDRRRRATTPRSASCATARRADPRAPAPSRSGRPRLNGRSVHNRPPGGPIATARP